MHWVTLKIKLIFFSIYIYNNWKSLYKYLSFIKSNRSLFFFCRNFIDGQRIIRQGDAADGMYFIEKGTVIISVLDDSGKEVEINRIVKGGYFGELALVTHRPRAASAFCDGEVKCACKYWFKKFYFIKFIKRFHGIFYLNLKRPNNSSNYSAIPIMLFLFTLRKLSKLYCIFCLKMNGILYYFTTLEKFIFTSMLWFSNITLCLGSIYLLHILYVDNNIIRLSRHRLIFIQF